MENAIWSSESSMQRAGGFAALYMAGSLLAAMPYFLLISKVPDGASAVACGSLRRFAPPWRRQMNGRSVKSLVIVSSCHHKNTEKVAEALANALGAEVRRPQDVDPEKLREHDLVGFGSGIDSDRHYAALLDLADGLPRLDGKKAFIFSTCGIPVSVAGEESIRKYSVKSHLALREKLTSHGYSIIGEYSCAGFNTNSFLRLFGGVNRGRPNAEDLGGAREFARKLKAAMVFRGGPGIAAIDNA